MEDGDLSTSHGERVRGENEYVLVRTYSSWASYGHAQTQDDWPGGGLNPDLDLSPDP